VFFFVFEKRAGFQKKYLAYFTKIYQKLWPGLAAKPKKMVAKK
jgi:hypothetical protein